MRPKKNKREYFVELRKQAVEAIAEHPAKAPPASYESVRELNQELEIHRIELELQCEEFHKLQEELDRFADKFRRYHQACPVGLFVFNRKGRILEVNPAGAALLESEPIGLINQHLPFFLPEDGESHYLHLATVAATDTTQRCRIRLRDKEGIPWHVELATLPIHYERGETARFLSAVTDVTDFVGAEEERDRFEFEAVRNRKRGEELLALVSKEIHPPILAIANFLERLGDDPKGQLRNHQKKMIRRILTQFARINGKIERLTGIQSKTIRPETLDPRFLDGKKTADAVLEEMRGFADQKGIGFGNEIPPGTRLRADFDLFRTVLQTLILRSIRSCGSGDTIRLFVPQGKPFVLAYRDTGPGISRTLLRQFVFKGDLSPAESAEYSELENDLALCRRAMEVQGGRFRFDTEEHSGTAFYLEFLAVSPVVLLVLQNPIERNYLRTLLKRLGVRVLEADNGEEASTLLERSIPDLILSETVLPGLNGLEFLDRVRSHGEFGSVPFVLIVPELDGTETWERAFDLGASDVLTWPIRKPEFLPRLRRLIG